MPALVPLQAAFGGWALYRANLFRGPDGCRHDPTVWDCEHLSLARCLRERRQARQYIATGLVVHWEGCSEEEQNKRTEQHS